MKKTYLLLIMLIGSLSITYSQVQTITPAPNKKGEMLAILADCQACHTYKAGNGEPFAGGYPIGSPMGNIYSSNITPSLEYGIGHYTLADFTRALKEGINAQGTHLYPAMPYTAYAKMTDQDISDLYQYFMHDVKPVDSAPIQRTDLPFPFDMRALMIVWNALYLNNEPYEDNPLKSAQWNRGAYIVEALAHCGMCHTPRDFMMAEDTQQYLAGGQVGAWYAPNITGDKNAGIGTWSQQEIIEYLQTGHLTGKAQAAGPMAEAVENSFQYAHEDDLKAIAVYLQEIPSIANTQQSQPRESYGAPYDVDIALRGLSPVNANLTLNSGASLYSAYCATCHQDNGAGTEDQFYPSLFHNTATGDFNASNLIAVILNGVERQVGDTQVFMPAFSEGSPSQALSDEQIAKIAQFVMQKYGNPNVTITLQDVADIRQGGPKPLLLKLQPYFIPALVLLLALLGGIILHFRRQKRRKNRR